MEHSSSFRKIIDMRFGLLLAFLSGVLLFPCRGQQYYFDQFSVSEGLAQSTVYKVIQDRNDIYWMGTLEGVSSFDGVEFINYSAADGLAGNGVRAICEDRNGAIWFGHTGGGVTRFRQGRFEALTGRSEFVDSDISSILEDTAGHLWFTTDGSGVIRITNPDAPMEDLALEQFSGRDLSDRVFGSHMDPEGKIYFITDINVKYFRRDQARFDNLQLNGIPRYYLTTCILVDRRGHTWFGKHNGGLYRYDPATDTSEMFDLVKAGLKSNWVSTLFEDRSGRIWAGTWEGGIARVDTMNRLMHFSNENGMPGMKIWSIGQDREGNVLIGTHENGMCVHKGDHFVNYFKEDGLINPQVGAVLQTADGRYWFGTNEGISILERTEKGDRFTDYGWLRGESIGFLEEDSRGRVWIGTDSRGVFHYEQPGRHVYDQVLNRSTGNYQITAMETDGEDNLWVGTLDGLFFYETEKEQVTRLSQENGLRDNYISAVFADSKDRIWVGAMGKGLTVIENNRFRQLETDFDFTPRSFAEDRDGNIWVGTEGRGLILWDPDLYQMIRRYTKEEGLLANVINQLSSDLAGNIYIGTNKGLNIYHRGDQRIYAHTAGSGFVGIETKANASFVDRLGNIWFGTLKGVTRYTPGEGSLRRTEPLTHITGMEVNHRAVLPEEGLSLHYKQNSIIFTYRCITLNPDNVAYQIMLKGVDPEWREPDNQTRATYPALRHGKYTFLVRARSSEGVWNEEPVSFSFEIRPPFYLTWYFIVFVVFMTGLLIFVYIQIRERALRRENAILEEKVRDRTATVVAQKEELAQKNKDITDSIRYAKRIQFAILPESSPYPESFILFKPKDIVSGDFYWFTQVNGKEFLSAVDCTGHGVPGAFMSIIGHNSLTKIVREYGILEPGKILTQLNSEVMKTLHQRSDSGDVYDGMDLALVCYDREKNLLEFAGAFNPLYLIRDGEIMEVKADKVSIGRSSVIREVEFTNHRIQLQKGDTIYLFSDGYADQFGGELMKKFKYKNLKQLILRLQPESMAQQRIILDKTIEEWRGDLDQLDDILVIGRRFS